MDHNNHDVMEHDQHAKHADHMMHNSTLPPAMTHSPYRNPGDHVMDNGMTSHTGHDMSGHMMKMYFHVSANATILFSGWKTTSWETMLGSCIAVFIIAGLYEGLKVFREHLLCSANRAAKYNSVPVQTTNNDDSIVTKGSKTSPMRMLSLVHLIQTLLHLVQIVVSYFLMLIFMTYNVWLCIAVALGATTGYFVFSWRRPIVIDFNEHCH